MSAGQTIRLERAPGVAHVILNRPERLNAINGQMITELSALMDRLEADEEVSAIVLSGAGAMSCRQFLLPLQREILTTRLLSHGNLIATHPMCHHPSSLSVYFTS